MSALNNREIAGLTKKDKCDIIVMWLRHGKSQST